MGYLDNDPCRYPNFKEVKKVVALPDKPSVVALIDVDKVTDWLENLAQSRPLAPSCCCFSSTAVSAPAF